MSFRLAAIIIVVLLQLFAATNLAEAQRQKGKIGGGGGFAFLTDPDIDLGSTASFGGFFGLRFNDNWSLEGGLYFVRSNRVFNEFDVPIDKTPDTPAFRFETTRYHADGVLMLNIGRRQPFHPFVIFGGGVERRDDKQTDFTFELDPDTGLPLPLSAELEVVLNETKYLPTAIVGGGAEIYFMYNLAARTEFRLWMPQDWDQRTFIFFFAATYYF